MRSRKTLIPIFAACLIFAGAAFGATLESPNTAGRDGDLRLSGPDGFVLNQSFKAGEVVSISLFDKAGYSLADGRYKWEMTFKGDAAGDRDGVHSRVEPAWGSFTIKNGAVVNRNALEVSLTKDQQILDDLIVDGSICVGQDCNNGESFGFDTIRMKENNLRIRAFDTSNSASFPTRDWQITFNDSSNGGANKFSIDDIDGGRTPFTIEAGARTNALFVEDSGQIGIGTDAPVADLHVKNGNTPTLRLEQDGSSGFTAQTWDMAGNEANLFIRDVTNGSDLPFRIFPDAGTNALTIEGGTGDIGMGTNSPAQNLHIVDSGGANIRITGTSVGFQLQESDAAGRFIQQNFNNSLLRLRGLDSSLLTETEGIQYDVATGLVAVGCDIAVEPGGVDFIVGTGTGNCSGTYSAITAGSGVINTSSRSLKENFQQVETGDILEKISAIDVYTYDFINGPKDSMGLIAEDFHQVFGRGSDKVISDREMQMAMWLAIQQLTGQVKDLKAELAAAQAD